MEAIEVVDLVNLRNEKNQPAAKKRGQKASKMWESFTLEETPTTKIVNFQCISLQYIQSCHEKVSVMVDLHSRS